MNIQWYDVAGSEADAYLHHFDLIKMTNMPYLKNKYGEKVYNRNGKVKGDGN